MKKLFSILAVSIWMLAVMFFVTPITADAANVTSGVLGDNGGIHWTYDADTKTLTVTGEDTGTWGIYHEDYRSEVSVFKSICGDVENIIVADCKLYDCRNLFAGLNSLINISFENFDTSQVTDMSGMFRNCIFLTSLDLGSFDTSQVRDMSLMFEYCPSLEYLNVSSFDTSNVVDMAGMFMYCKVKQLDVSGFNTSQVTNTSAMFGDCEELTSLDVSGFDTSNVESMGSMFQGCKSLTELDVSGFDTSKAESMGGMFYGCEKITSLDLSNFSLINTWGDEPESMLHGCESLEVIYTPKDMLDEQTLELPGTFVDLEKNRTIVITKEFCNNTLIVDKLADLMEFVERMYTVALGREAESDGLDFYTRRLRAGDSNGACLAESFLCSPEFKNKNHDNAQYVKVLYATFFDREPVAEEVNYWVGKINDGQSREFVLSGFVNSVEFDKLCAEYGISRGYLYEDGKPANPGLGRFAERLYTKALGRDGEKDGIEYWTLQIAGGACTPKDAAKSFFMSKEYIDKNTSNVQYIVNLYETFMDRQPENDGIYYWEYLLLTGTTREQVMEGFANSPEFAGIMTSFGL